MKKCLLAWVAFAGVSITSPTFATGTEIMTVKDIRPGMKGYGLTVFQGTKPEKFEFEVVGVISNFFPHQDMIVVNCSHPILSHTGIYQGMSGSPMYIEGKQIGALGYGFPGEFPKNLLAGVTPIERMIEDGNRHTNPETPTLPPQESQKPGSIRKSSSDPSIRRLDIPFSISGFGPKTSAFAIDYFRDNYGMQLSTASGGGATDDPTVPSDLQPGDTVGIQMMRGDMRVGGAGTISYRNGNRFLAFGHPMDGLGDTEFPVTTGRVLTVVSGLRTSFVLQNLGKEVGVMTIDRQSCIAGELGRKARMVPIHIRVKNRNTGLGDEFHSEVAPHRLLAPILFRIAVMNALESAENTVFPTTTDLTLKMSIDGRLEPIVLNETYASSSGPGDPFMIFPALALAGNSFSPVQFSKFEANIEVLHERRTADIEAAWLDLNEVKAGGKVNLTVVLRPFGKETERLVVPITVPENLPEESYDLEVGAGNQTEPDAAAPKNLDDVIRLMQARYRASDLVTVMELGTIGTRQEGKALRKLPFSVFGTLLASSAAGVTVAPDTMRVVTPTKYVLNGKKSLKIKVTDKGGD